MCTLHEADGRARQDSKDFGTATLYRIDPLGFHCVKFASNWAVTRVILRPRVRTSSWLHISAVIKISNKTKEAVALR